MDHFHSAVIALFPALGPSAARQSLTLTTQLSSNIEVQMNNSTTTNEPMFQRSACDTKAIASPLMPVEITMINKSAHMSAH